jgi:hypothetical protein
MQNPRPLKQALIQAYGGFADNRIKNIDRGSIFIADDRGPADHNARKQLFLWFCLIFVEVISGDLVRISLQGGVPKGAAVADWVRQHNAEQTDKALIFDVMPADVEKLRELAASFRSIVEHGARYPVAAYKYVCPRTAASLERLHSVLRTHWT